MAMELVWLGQGGFLIRCGGASICLDPYLSDSCERSGGHTRIAPAPLDPASIDADVFVITHDHMDHLDEGTLRQIDLTAHLFAAPASCRRHLRALGVPEDRLLSFDRGEEFGIGDAELHAVFADHTEDSIGLIVRAGGQTAYFTADTLFNPRLQEEAAPFAPDILVPCINGRAGGRAPGKGPERQARHPHALRHVRRKHGGPHGLRARDGRRALPRADHVRAGAAGNGRIKKRGIFQK